LPDFGGSLFFDHRRRGNLFDRIAANSYRTLLIVRRGSAELFEKLEQSSSTGKLVVLINAPIPVLGYLLNELGFCCSERSGNLKSSFLMDEAVS
jgi:hypothetical protein